MRIGIFLGHPAHYYYNKNIAKQLQLDGHQVFFAVKEKDILTKLLETAQISYTKVRGKRGNSKLAMVWSVVKMDFNIVKFVKKNHIDLMLGVPPVWGTRLLCRKPVIFHTEDDASVVGLLGKVLYPLVSELITPQACDNGKWDMTSIKYPGFQKLTYLHPNWFKVDKGVVRKNGINPNEPYFLMRFAKLNAHHDAGVSGISTEIARRLVEMLAPHGKIYITSERPLEPEFEQYRLHINPLDIHHVMAYATLYIGDSQSMANEAAMLGVPSLRFNDFVGAKKIGVMEELEHKYGLTYGISSHEPEKLYAKIEELLAMPNLREEFQSRRQKMLKDKIDVTAFLTYFIENYPDSAREAKTADIDFWERFKLT